MSYQLLLLDDSSTIDQAVSITFDKEALFDVERSTSPEDLLATASVLKPDVILLDARLPRADSFQLCQDLKSHPPTRSSRILLLAPSVGDFDPQEVLTCGADGHVVKPFETQVLIDRVKELVGEPVTPSVAAVRRLRRSTPPPPPPADLTLPKPEPGQPAPFAPPPKAEAPLATSAPQTPSPSAPRAAAPPRIEFAPPRRLHQPTAPQYAPPEPEPTPQVLESKFAQAEFAPPIPAEPSARRAAAEPGQPVTEGGDPGDNQPRAQRFSAPTEPEPIVAEPRQPVTEETAPGDEPGDNQPQTQRLSVPTDLNPIVVEPRQTVTEGADLGDNQPQTQRLSVPAEPEPEKAPTPTEEERKPAPLFIPPPLPEEPTRSPAEPEVTPVETPAPKPSGPLLPPPPVVGARAHKAPPAQAPVSMIEPMEPMESIKRTNLMPPSLQGAEEIPAEVTAPAEVEPLEISGVHPKASRAAAAKDSSHQAPSVQLPELETMVRSLTNETIERIVWEVVPQLAETMIRERLHELTERASSNAEDTAN